MVNIRQEEKQGKLIVHLAGRLDVQSANKLEEEMDKILRENSDKDMLIDMSGVEYLSSTGLRVLISLVRNLKEKGRELRLYALRDPVRKVFNIVQLEDMFQIYETEEEALKG